MTSRRKTPLRPNRGHESDRKYKAWIRSLPCICCHLHLWQSWLRYPQHDYVFTLSLAQQYGTEAAHTGPRGKGQLAADRTVVPLCSLRHHREGPESHHKLGLKFWDYWGLDRAEIVRKLNALYDAERRPA